MHQRKRIGGKISITSNQKGRQRIWKPRRNSQPMEINFITARAFGRMYKKAQKSKDQMGILSIKTNGKEITIASATISTELAIAEKRTKDEQHIQNLIPREYHD